LSLGGDEESVPRSQDEKGERTDEALTLRLRLFDDEDRVLDDDLFGVGRRLGTFRPVDVGDVVGELALDALGLSGRRPEGAATNSTGACQSY
jgi:hypothetical protein